MAWPWPFVLSWLSKKAIFFFCLLREICFLTLLYMLKALFLDEHNTSSNVTCTNNLMLPVPTITSNSYVTSCFKP